MEDMYKSGERNIAGTDAMAPMTANMQTGYDG